jgi:hypothetical protein
MPGAVIPDRDDGPFVFAEDKNIFLSCWWIWGDRMELMQLEMFVAVFQERSVRRAAERVCRTQPAVSLALGKLEWKIGSRLVERGRGDYQLTYGKGAI